MAEDASIFFVSRRIAGNFAQVEAVGGVGGLQQHDTVLGVQPLLHTLQSPRGLSGLLADAGHDAHALRLNKDLALVALLAAHRLAKGIVSAAEPFAVPAGGQDGLLHPRDGLPCSGGLVGKAAVAAQVRILFAVLDEHTGDEDALGHGALAGAGDLEALARVLREAVQVEAVVPVGPADEGQAVGAKMGAGVLETAAQVLHQGLRLAFVIVKGHGLIQNAPVARLTQISGGAGNEPERVIVEAGAHVPVALFGQGLVLVVGAAVLKLGGGNVQDTAPGTGGDHVHKAQQVLAAVPEAHAAANAALVIAGAAAHVERDHALVLVPDADHPVQLLLAGVQLPAGEQSGPIIGQHPAGLIHLGIGGVAGHHGPGAGLVEDAGSNKFLLLRVFDVAQAKDDALFFTGSQGDVEMVGTHRGPAVGHAVGAMPGQHGLRGGGAAVDTAERVPAGVKAGDGGVGPEHGIVVAALPVLGLMINGAALYLYFTGGEVALEVGAVVHSIPQAKLHIAEHIQRAGGGRLIFQSQAVDLTGVAPGDEDFLRGSNAVFLALKNGVAQAVAAGVVIQRRLGGLPAGVPDSAAIVDIDAVAVHIQRGVVVAVAGDAAEPGIPVKAVAARRVGDQAEKVLTAQVVDPWQWGLWGINDILPAFIIKVTKLHRRFLLLKGSP